MTKRQTAKIAKELRLATLRRGRDLSAAGDHAGAREAFAAVGISYISDHSGIEGN